MNAINLINGDDLRKKIEHAIFVRTAKRSDVAKAMGITTKEFEDVLNQMSLGKLAQNKAQKFATSFMNVLGINDEEILGVDNYIDYEIISSIQSKVKTLLKARNMTFVALAKKVNYTNAGLHRVFSDNNLSIKTLVDISKALNVDVSYFFEDIIFEKFIDVVVENSENNDLKALILNIERNLLKGLSLEQATLKAVAPDKYNRSLVQ